jgi:hypothetical protein
MRIKIMSNYYIHVKPPDMGMENYEFINLDKIETALTEESVDQIHIHDLLDYLDHNMIIGVLQLIKSRLKNNGKLSAQGTDIKSSASSLLHGQININTFRSIIYGIDSDKKSSYSISEIKSIFNDIGGMQINKVYFLNGSQYYIECDKYE